MKRKREGEIQQVEEEEEVEVVVVVEQRSVSKFGGDGVAWFRGSMIGKGSFGSVYLANSKKPKSRYGCFPPIMAVKSAEVSVSGSIQKEREVLSNIGRCPNIIRSYGEEITTAENGEMVYNLLLEYGSGGTLADLIKKSGGCGLPLCEVRYYAKSILLGLNHIHGCGYVHCDLKPDNILLVPNNTHGGGAKFMVKIGDFGLTKRAQQNNKKRKLDLIPYWRGTPTYLSPEVVADCVQEAPSDIWAFGCIVLEMLTGKSPWVGKEDLDAEALLHMIGEGGESPKIPDEISREGRKFLKGCFSRKTMFRLTTEMLLNHSFMEGVMVDVDDDEVEEEEGILDANEVDDLTFMLYETDEECSSSSFSGDYGFESEEEFFISSRSEEEEINSEEFSRFDVDGIWEGQQYADIVIAPALGDVINATKQVPTNTMQPPPISFPIPAGV